MNFLLPATFLSRLLGGVDHVARKYYWLIVFILLLWKLLTTGLGTIPREPYLLVAQDPFTRVEVHPQNYFQRSPLLPLIANFLGMTSRSSFMFLSLAILLAGGLLFAGLSRKKLASLPALILTALVVGHPVMLVQLAWLGTPDVLTFLFATLILFTRTALTIALISALGAFNHPMFVLIAPALLVLRSLSNDEILRSDVVACGVGLLCGTLAVEGFLRYFEIETYSRIDFITSRSFVTWLRQNLSLLPHTIFSLHGFGWLTLALVTLVTWFRDRVFALALAVVHILFAGVTFFSADTTRVFSALAWAPLAFGVIHSIELLEKDLQAYGEAVKALLSIALLGLLVPGYYMWVGELHLPPINSTYSMLFDTIVGLVD